MEINTFQDLAQRAADIKQKAIFNDYIPENSIYELINKQQNIEQIKVSNEDFLTRDKGNVLSITYDLDNTTYFIMGRWKSGSGFLNPLWFGTKKDSYIDYMYCYPNQNRATTLSRITKERDLIISIKYSEQFKNLVKVSEYDNKTSEYIKLYVNKEIEEKAMDIFNSAKESMNIFYRILKKYKDSQLKCEPR